MKKHLLTFSAAALLICAGHTAARAQSTAAYGGGSSGKSIVSGGVDADGADTLYIGAGTHNIDGTWEIYSSYVLIDPAAIITGSGTMVFFNPSLGFGSSVPTRIDANNITNALDVNLQVQNDQGMQLSNLSFPADFATAGWTESTTSSSLYAGRDIDLAVDGANISLGTGVAGDLRLESDATISNYQPSRMVITNNSILSHMVKEGFTTAFTFPVGIAAGDYTPAEISNASSNTVSVSVQDYANSASVEQLVDGVTPTDGMDRTWNIFATTTGISSTLNLQHNSSTNQTIFVDALHFVTRWGTTTPDATGDVTVPFGTSSWQTNTAGAGATGNLSSTGTVAGSSMRSRTYSDLPTSATDNGAYYSKSSDAIAPLPVSISQFSANAKDCDVLVNWKSGVENPGTVYTLQHSTDGVLYKDISTMKAGGSNTDYSYVHRSPGNGKHLYRLQLSGKQNETETTQVKNVTVSCNKAQQQVVVKVYPNPTTGVVFLEGMNLGNSAQTDAVSIIRILNLHGQVLKEMNTRDNKVSLDITELPAAPYLVQWLQDGEIRMSTQIHKQ